MKIEVTVFVRDDETLKAIRSTLDMLLSLVKTQGDTIMATQDQLAADLGAVKDQVAKIGAETGALVQKVSDLEAALAAAGNTTPAVDAAMHALKDQVKVVDDMVADVPPATP